MRINKKIIVLIGCILTVFCANRLLRGEGMDKGNDQKSNVQTCGFTDEQLKENLTPEQYRVMRQSGTEKPFANKYWDNKKAGIYVDPISKKVLFSSLDKFDSGTGWPSFTKPISTDAIAEKADTSSGMSRTEVRSVSSDSHVGHVFNDGPAPTGLRYCLNSAALLFIPLEEMAEKGYSEYLSLFNSQTAYFGAGCFWGIESEFSGVKGVLSTRVGYMGGHTQNPTYEQVCSDKTQHAEVVRVIFDPKQVNYKQLLEIFWKIHDPTTKNRQGPDVGLQYRSVIFYTSPMQKKEAFKEKETMTLSKAFKKPIVTEIVPAGEFWEAEEYHQKYFQKKGIKPTCHVNFTR